MKIVLGVGWFVLGLFQLAAIVGGINEWTSMPNFLSFFIALFLAYIPLVGTLLGIFGAVTAWGWSFLMASALFMGPFAAFLIIVLIASRSPTSPTGASN